TMTRENYVYVSDEAPVADPGGPYSPIEEGQGMQFDGSGSYDPNGGDLTYDWDFGDGSAGSSGENPWHTYAQDSEEQTGEVYSVTLTVTDEAELEGSNTTTVEVTDIDPVADFTADVTSGTQPLTVQFTDLSNTYDGIVSWTWGFGDTQGSSDQNPQHTYTNAGTYTVTLTVTEDDGDTSTEVKTGYITVGECTVYYYDGDEDGYGTDDSQCLAEPEGFYTATESGDCDDDRGDIYPGAEEVCDYEDNDCDDLIDEGVTTTFYQDADGDGFGNPEIAEEACEAPEGYVTDNTDCDDTRSDVNPGATEVCDGVDNNCDDLIDEGVTSTFYQDADGDGFGNPDVTTQACEAPEGYVTDNTDCDDDNPAVNPGADEVCGDGIDNNCNGEVDEGCGCEINEIPGDLDGDCDVDFTDRGILWSSLRTCDGDAGYNADADYDGDGCITFNDYRIWYGHYKAFNQGT
ncbi:MAG: PKD domain-containing protein, partial [Thermodesulfobacteriota bacterium]|nr:PKD domain-containing protein [Thermodesulfobacteriota bacterium]